MLNLLAGMPTSQTGKDLDQLCYTGFNKHAITLAVTFHLRMLRTHLSKHNLRETGKIDLIAYKL